MMNASCYKKSETKKNQTHVSEICDAFSDNIKNFHFLKNRNMECITILSQAHFRSILYLCGHFVASDSMHGYCSYNK